MKKILFSIAIIASLSASAQDKVIKDKVVETSCGECQFGMKGKGCDLAVRIEGKNYFVTGTKIDQHGDSHASDGFCNAIRKAKVSGEIKEDKFVVTSFELLPNKEQ